ncbi:hypothetical protein BZJ19_02885 [Salinivibrio proteolyticus]|nr:hypothetical protein BZJ19_02885 [Salinivibrio proteolyticus]
MVSSITCSPWFYSLSAQIRALAHLPNHSHGFTHLLNNLKRKKVSPIAEIEQSHSQADWIFAIMRGLKGHWQV